MVSRLRHEWRTRAMALAIVVLAFLSSCDQFLGMLGLGTETPATPGSFTANVLSATQVKLLWTTNETDIDRYSIERAEGQQGVFEQVATPGGADMSYTDGPLTPGTLYRYRMRAANKAGYSPYTTEKTAITPLGTSIPGISMASTGMRLNAGTIGDGLVESRLSGLDDTYTLQARTVSASRPDPAWTDFTIDAAGEATISMPVADFSAGSNMVQLRYICSLTAETSVSVAEFELLRGGYDGLDGGWDPLVDVAATRIGASGPIASDAILKLDLQNEAAPWVVTESKYILPAADGSLLVTGVPSGRLFRLEGDFEDSEYFGVILYARRGMVFTDDIVIKPQTGAVFKGKVMVYDGTNPQRPFDVALDGPSSLVLVARDDNTALVNAALDINLDGSDPRYDPDTGYFTFDHLAGGTYGISHWWPAQRKQGTWFDPTFVVSAGETLDMESLDQPLSVWTNTYTPVILIQHHDWSGLSWQSALDAALEADQTYGPQATYFEQRYLGAAQIMDVLTDPTDPIHDRVSLVLANPVDLTVADASFTTLVTSFADFATLGVDKASYADTVEKYATTMYGLPFVGGNTLGLFYRRSDWNTDAALADAEVMALTADDLANGAAGTIAQSWREPYYLMPWYNAYGGAGKYTKASFDQAAFAKALLYAAQLAGRYGESLPTNASDDYGTAEYAFRTGAVKLFIQGDWGLLGNLDTVFGNDLGCWQLPNFTTGEKPKPLSTTRNFYIVDTAKAAALATLLTGTFDAAFWNAQAGTLHSGAWIPPAGRAPALRGLSLSGATIYGKAFYNELMQAEPMPLDPDIKPFWNAATPKILSFFASGRSEQDAADAALAVYTALP